jgi:phosphate transport system permease protein
VSSVALKASADAFAIRRPRVAKLLRRAPRFRDLLAILGGAIPASVVGVVIFLTIYAWPAVTLNGWGFLSGSEWNLGNAYGDPILENGVSVLPGAHYAILFLIGGTLISTGIAMVVAVPVGVGAAIFLAEAVPNWARLWLSLFVELLAAIPSVVFGLWGYAVLIPMLGKHVAPAMTHWLGWIPFFGGSPGNGYGLLTAGLVLSLMIVPLITVTLRDAIVRQPDSLRETAAALGATCFETIWFVIMPGLRTVLIGACVLAIGRAMGETMAVLMVSGNALGALPPNIFGPVSTMASFIVSQLDSALADPTGFAIRSLAEIALALCLVHRCQHARSASPFLCRRRPVMSAASHVSEPRRRVAHDLALGRRRRLVSLLGWTLCAAGFVMLGVAMSWILGMILVSGISALSLRIFIEPTQGNGGGLLNAIEGTAVLAAGTLILAVPLAAPGRRRSGSSATRWSGYLRSCSAMPDTSSWCKRSDGSSRGQPRV